MERIPESKEEGKPATKSPREKRDRSERRSMRRLNTTQAVKSQDYDAVVDELQTTQKVPLLLPI